MDSDDLLREIAHVDDVAPPSDPDRVAHFRVIERIGRGAMGIVYKAHDEQLDRVVALKLLEDRSRLLREARAAAALDHPNIAVVHGTGEDDGRVFIAMELIEGATLRRVLEDERLPLDRVRRIARQIASALAHAHARGVTHRDLKPDNIMIGADDHVTVLDFGLAKREDGTPRDSSTSTAKGGFIGTPSYMAPEQAHGKKTDARADVFSFGVILYEMLAGRRPFAGESAMEVMVAISRDAAPPLSRDVPTALDALVRRCLEKSPEHRFANGTELGEALDTMPTRAPRRWWLFAAAGAAVLGVAVVAKTTPPKDPVAAPKVVAESPPPPSPGAVASVLPPVEEVPSASPSAKPVVRAIEARRPAPLAPSASVSSVRPIASALLDPLADQK